MQHSSKSTLCSLSIALLLGACSSQQNRPPETAGNDEATTPNSADINEDAMKEAEEEAEARRVSAAEEATENVDEASVVQGDTGLKTEDVNTGPQD